MSQIRTNASNQNINAYVSSKAISLKADQSLSLHPNFVRASSEGSSEFESHLLYQNPVYCPNHNEMFLLYILGKKTALAIYGVNS